MQAELSPRQVARSTLRSLVGRDTLVLVAIADVDNLNLLSDAQGHQAGDRVLERYETELSGSLWPQEFGCWHRWGGDEFLLIAPCSQPDGIVEALNRFVTEAELSAEPFRHDARTQPLKTTLSIGAHWRTLETDDDIAVLLKEADDALYQAKRAGKARLRCAT